MLARPVVKRSHRVLGSRASWAAMGAGICSLAETGADGDERLIRKTVRAKTAFSAMAM
jgi:hypothetical protein